MYSFYINLPAFQFNPTIIRLTCDTNIQVRKLPVSNYNKEKFCQPA